MKRKLIVAFIAPILILIFGGFNMVLAQEKPPLLGSPTNTRQRENVPLPGGQTAPTPPLQGKIKPPPAQQLSSPQPPIVNSLPLNNASHAVETAKKAKELFTAGKIWTVTGPRGETDVKAAILYEGIVVAVLHFNPIDGSLLPIGFHPLTSGATVQIESIRNNLPKLINSLEVLNGAEYREPESVWAVPLAYKGMIVAHLKIYMDGIHIVPDYPANQEMKAYGR